MLPEIPAVVHPAVLALTLLMTLVVVGFVAVLRADVLDEDRVCRR
jgi:hypothetical protein